MDRIDAAFPAPEFRKHQRGAIEETMDKLSENDVVVLKAPTGAGKSLILYTIAKAFDVPAYYVTPLNSLIDQIERDGFIGDKVLTFKGMSNYSCVHPDDEGESVDLAICQRENGFTCGLKEMRCPYYSRKSAVDVNNIVVTNISMLLSQGALPPDSKTLQPRPLLIVDECQSVEDFVVDFVTVDLDRLPSLDAPEFDTVEDAAMWAKTVMLPQVEQESQMLERRTRRTKEETEYLQMLGRLYFRINLFARDALKYPDQWSLDRGPYKLQAKPITIGRIVRRLLWSWGAKVIISSATIPDGFLGDVGLKEEDVGRVTVPSTFPAENRPIILDKAVGPMTQDERGDTAPKMSDAIQELSKEHGGEKGMIHCRAYSIAKMLWDECDPVWLEENAMMQDRDDREGSLKKWKESDKQVFFSISMDEGIDLKGDLCRWQVLAKALYKFMGDSRVRERVFGRGYWDWYQRSAAVQIQQAYGRGVRSDEDWCTFYVLDSSAVGLIDRCDYMFEDWFLEAIDP